MNDICEVRNSIRDIKARKDVHSEQVKDNKRLWDELETKNTIIKLLIDNSKQLADSIGKSNTTVPLFHTKETEMYLLLKLLETKDLQSLLINTQKDKPTFRGLMSSLVPNYLVKLLYHQNVKETFWYLLIVLIRGFALEKLTLS